MVEFDKYYKLKDKYYWCIQLQKYIRFKDGVAVKAAQRTALDASSDGRLWFGKVISDRCGYDFETEIEINFFLKDVICEYELKVPQTSMLCFIDFPYNIKPEDKPFSEGCLVDSSC
jgi:hypothetical protein